MSQREAGLRLPQTLYGVFNELLDRIGGLDWRPKPASLPWFQTGSYDNIYKQELFSSWWDTNGPSLAQLSPTISSTVWLSSGAMQALRMWVCSRWLNVFFVCFSFQFHWDTIDITHCKSWRYTAEWFTTNTSWKDYHSKFSEHLSSHIGTKFKEIGQFFLVMWTHDLPSEQLSYMTYRVLIIFMTLSLYPWSVFMH